MKNIINLAANNSTRQGKLTISGSDSTDKKNTRSISYSHSDSFIDELSISLKGYKPNHKYTGAQKIIHDCNSNNVSLNPPKNNTNLRRLKSWNKGFTRRLRELEENLPTSDEIIENLRQQVKNNSVTNHKRTKGAATSDWQGIGYSKDQQWQGVGYNVSDQWKGFGFTLEEPTDEKPNSTTAQSKRNFSISNELRQRISKSDLPAPLRKLSTLSTATLSRKSSDTSLNSIDSPTKPEYIDFGACYSPEEMKTWGQVIDKLATTIQNTNNTAHRRFSSISGTLSSTLKEPAKKYISNHSIRRRRKSYDCTHKKPTEIDIIDGGDRGTKDNSLEDVSGSNDKLNGGAPDVSLSREVMDDMLVSTNDVSFSSNIWYCGEIDIGYCSKVNSGTSVEERDDVIVGTLLTRIDCYGDVVYSITYSIDDEMLVGTFPSECGKFCLDFTDAEQPRFRSVKFMIAYLIEQKYLQRVTFSWLIDHCEIL